MADFYKAIDELEQADSTRFFAHALREFDTKLESLFDITMTTNDRVDRIDGNCTSEAIGPKGSMRTLVQGGPDG